MSDAFKDFLAKRETSQKASAASSQRLILILIILAVAVVITVVLFRGDPSTRILNPNTATIEELVTLPDVGPELAKAIIKQRSTKPFAKPEDLLEVKGIGPKTLDKIRPRLKLDNAK